MLGSNLVLSQLLRQIVPRDHLLFSSTPNDQVQDQDSVSLSPSLSSLIDEGRVRERERD